MKLLSKILLLLGITALMAGCKLAVIVVEGGEVQSTGSGGCLAGSVCIVVVDDPSFSETFEAVPHEGWYFDKWHSGDRFFCRGSTKPTCALSFQGHENSQAVEEMVESSEVFYLMPVFTPYQDIIEVGGKQWFQPDLFLNLSLHEISAVCPKGLCTGTLKGQDMTGWRWALADDVNALFNHYIGFDALGPGPDVYAGPETGTGVTAFFNDGWRPIFDQIGARVIQGWIRDSHPGGLTARIFDVPADHGLLYPEVRTELGGQDKASNGAWFYRTP